MVEFWYSVLALALIAYSVLDGFDFGAGILHGFVAKTDSERRAVFAAIGPFWDGNEVWLLAAGGVLFMTFPAVLAMAFPGFYLAFFLVLWCFILRGVSIEVRSHIDDGMWRAFWDLVFAVSSALLALLFGVALGNLVRGLPIDAQGEFTMPLFTDFRTTGKVGILDHYTVSVGALSVVLLAAHGAAFLAWRTESLTRERAMALERWLWPGAALLFALVTVETFFVRPDLFEAMARRPLAWVFAASAAAGGVAVVMGRRQQRDLWVFLGSSAVIAGLLAAAAVGFFPIILHSTLNAAYDVDAHAHAASPYSLRSALAWWPIAFALTVSYFALVFRTNRGRVKTEP